MKEKNMHELTEKVIPFNRANATAIGLNNLITEWLEEKSKDTMLWEEMEKVKSLQSQNEKLKEELKTISDVSQDYVTENHKLLELVKKCKKSLKMMLETNSMHGPCKNNNCTNCQCARVDTEFTLSSIEKSGVVK